MIAFEHVVPDHEEAYNIVIGPKTEYQSLDDFVTQATAFLDKRDHIESDRDNWTASCAHRTYTSAEAESSIQSTHIFPKDAWFSLELGPVIGAFHIVPPKWDDFTLGIETQSEYIFYSWSTSA